VLRAGVPQSGNQGGSRGAQGAGSTGQASCEAPLLPGLLYPTTEGTQCTNSSALPDLEAGACAGGVALPQARSRAHSTIAITPSARHGPSCSPSVTSAPAPPHQQRALATSLFASARRRIQGLLNRAPPLETGPPLETAGRRHSAAKPAKPNGKAADGAAKAATRVTTRGAPPFIKGAPPRRDLTLDHAEIRISDSVSSRLFTRRPHAHWSTCACRWSTRWRCSRRACAAILVGALAAILTVILALAIWIGADPSTC